MQISSLITDIPFTIWIASVVVSGSKPYSYLTPVERRGWAWGLVNSSSRDEARSSVLAFVRKQGRAVHAI